MTYRAATASFRKMDQSRKRLALLLSPLITSLLLVLVGLITQSVAPISIAGLIWLFPLFVAFAFTDRLLFWLKAFREKRLGPLHFVGDLKISTDIKNQIESAWDIPIGFTGVLRALILSLAFCVVDLFLALADRDLSVFLEQIRMSLLGATLSLTSAAIDMCRGKSVRNPGLFLKALSVFGAVSFFRGFLLLISGIAGYQNYRPMKALFSSPLWFLFSENANSVVDWIVRDDVFTNIATRLFLPFFTFAIAMDMVKQPPTEDNVDSKNFALAMVITSCWFGSQWLAFFVQKL